MELVERPLEAGEPATEAAARRAGGRDSGGRVQYTCPMHPAFVAEDPKVRCPECGMALVEKRPAPGQAVAPSAPR